MKFISLFILTTLTIASYGQMPKGYYFEDVKGTTWFSEKNISDTTILNATEIGLRFLKSQPDSLRHNIWAFAEDLTITCYNTSTNKYDVVLTCKYVINEETRTIILQPSNMTDIKFNYNSVATGAYIVLYKPKQKKRNNHR